MWKTAYRNQSRISSSPCWNCLIVRDTTPLWRPLLCRSGIVTYIFISLAGRSRYDATAVECYLCIKSLSTTYKVACFEFLCCFVKFTEIVLFFVGCRAWHASSREMSFCHCFAIFKLPFFRIMYEFQCCAGQYRNYY